MSDKSHVEQRKNDFLKEGYTDTTERTVPVEKTTTTYKQAPDPATQEFIQQQAKPVAQSLGVDPNTGRVATPFEALGYDPEKERQRREAEQKLNQWKKKESAWYNALSIVGDALTAAHGGNVWKRNANKSAAEAEKDNQRLIAEQKAEDAYNRGKMAEKELSYAKYLNDLTNNYLTKTNVASTKYQKVQDVTQHGDQKGFNTKSHVVSEGDGDNGGGYNASGVYTGKNGKKISVTFNENPNNTYTDDFIVSPQDYDVVKNIIKQRYAYLITNGSTENKQATKNFLNSIGVVYDEDKGRFSDEDLLLQSGRYFGLDNNVRRKIKEKTGGRFDMMPRTYWQPSSGGETETNKPGKDAR